MPFRIEVRRGAGAYICGEETALFNSIEGHRGEPRSKPPFPVDSGLFGAPTLVHNVETLANVLRVLDPAGPGRETKLFSVSGCVVRPGVYEVPIGHHARRPAAASPAASSTGRALQAVLLGGAAGSFVRPDDVGVALTIEATRAVGATLGSGAVIVLDDRWISTRMVLGIAAFFREESCGQCVPCRVGTVRQEEALHRLADGSTRSARSTRRSSACATSARRCATRRSADSARRRGTRSRARSIGWVCSRPGRERPGCAGG